MIVGKKILLVEDDDVQRELMRMALERRGHVVTTAENGVRAYEEAVRLIPDLIVTDICMPSGDGVHLVRRVRDTVSIASVPILVTTGFGSGGATLSLSQGATAYEPKPFDAIRFVAAVDRLLRDLGDETPPSR